MRLRVRVRQRARDWLRDTKSLAQWDRARAIVDRSKLWNGKHGEDDVNFPAGSPSPTSDSSIWMLPRALAFPNYHAPGCDFESRSKDAKPYLHGEFMKTWRNVSRALSQDQHANSLHLDIFRTRVRILECTS